MEPCAAGTRCDGARRAVVRGRVRTDWFAGPLGGARATNDLKGEDMEKRVRAIVKLQIPAVKATPAQPIGPALGQHGINIMGFCKEYNERTANMVGSIVPAVITIYEDRSFTFITKT